MPPPPSQTDGAAAASLVSPHLASSGLGCLELKHELLEPRVVDGEVGGLDACTDLDLGAEGHGAVDHAQVDLDLVRVRLRVRLGLGLGSGSVLGLGLDLGLGLGSGLGCRRRES